jgi:hypothetical protein
MPTLRIMGNDSVWKEIMSLALLDRRPAAAMAQATNSLRLLYMAHTLQL